MTTHKRAAIDLGTNTCLLLIADVQESLVAHTVEDHSQVVRLGEGVDKNRVLKPEAMERTFKTLSFYHERVVAAGIKPSDVVAVATSQARDAHNARVFFDRCEKELGFKFKVLSGEEEAKVTFTGALLPGMNPDSTGVIDLGGGSTEFTSQTFNHSIDMGSVRFTERYFGESNTGGKSTLAVTDEQFWACRAAIDLQLRDFLKNGNPFLNVKEWVGVAGTATTLAAWYLDLPGFDAEKLNSVEFTPGDLHRMVEDLKWRNPAERAEIPSINATRADVILAGALILWRSMEALKIDKLRVSTRGLRYGLFSSAITDR